MTIRVVNTTRAQVVAERCDLARSFWERGRGLLGRSSLADGEGLIIYPEWSVHSFFMKFAIDVIFLDSHDVVVGLHPNMVPNRPFAGKWGARYVIELPTGVIAASQTQVGDQLSVTPSIH